jgi:hypothetical protein
LENFQKGVLPARPTDGRRGADTSRPSNGWEVPNLFLGPSRGSLLIREEAPDAAAGASRPPNGREVRGPCSAEGHPARWTDRRFLSPYISPHLPLNSHFIQQKSGKKEREERKRGEEAAKPCSHVGLEVYSRSSRIIT